MTKRGFNDKERLFGQMRIKICRKEAKESRYWLKLIDTQDDLELDNERKDLEIESTELMKIFGAILHKSE